MLSTGKAAFTSLTIWVNSRKSYNSLGFRQVFQTKITEMARAFVPQLNSILILQRICIKILSKAVQSIWWITMTRCYNSLVIKLVKYPQCWSEKTTKRPISAINPIDTKFFRMLGTYLTLVKFISPELVLTVAVLEPFTAWDSPPPVLTSWIRILLLGCIWSILLLSAATWLDAPLSRYQGL
jgi:hypothetical protein